MEKNGLSTSHRRKVMKETSTTATRVSTLPLVKKTFIFVCEEWFWKYLADAFGSVHDC